MNDIIEVLSIKKYKAGYEVREERISSHLENEPKDHTFIMKSAYTPSGDYIGNPKTAYFLCKKRRIKPEKAYPSDNVCSIGFCEREQKWAGYSHRALVLFGIGDKLFDENWIPEGASNERDECGFLIAVNNVPFKDRGSIIIKNMEQAKQAAMNFAEYIS